MPFDHEFGITDMGFQVLEDLDILNSAHYKVSHRLFEKLGFDIDDPFDLNKVSDLKEEFQEAGDNEQMVRKWIVNTSEKVEPVLEKVQLCLSEEKDALMFWGNSFFEIQYAII